MENGTRKLGPLFGTFRYFGTFRTLGAFRIFRTFRTLPNLQPVLILKAPGVIGWPSNASRGAISS